MDSASQCLVCRDYSKIDAIAIKFSLQNLWKPDQLGRYFDDRVKDYEKAQASFTNQVMSWSERRLELERNVKRKTGEKTILDTQLSNAETQLTALQKQLEKATLTPENSSQLAALQQAFDTARKALNTCVLDEQYLKDEEERETRKSKRDNEVCVKEIAAVGEEIDLLSNSVARYLWKECVKAKAATANDQIARARLFYTWIAVSFVWTDGARDIPAAKRDIPQSLLFTGMGVCSNFSELYKRFFDALFDDKIANAALLAECHTGDMKLTSRSCPVPLPQLNHAWNSFPYNGGRKFIDATWGGCSKEVQNNPSLFTGNWFTCSNEEFQQWHIRDMRGENRDAEVKAFWERDLPSFGGNQDVKNDLRINRASLQPQLAILGKADTITFSFRRSCEHIRNPFPVHPFITWNTVGDGVYRSRTLPFVLGADKLTWSVQLSLKDTFNTFDGKHIARIVLPFYKPEGVATKKVIAPITTADQLIKEKKDLVWVEVVKWELKEPGIFPTGTLLKEIDQIAIDKLPEMDIRS